MNVAQVTGGDRLAVLDGWRGVSIMLVLATHLLPLGPKSWALNEPAGVLGMAIFFTLSGFLITGFLLKHDSVVDFLIRRLFRIVPLAWTYLAIALVYVGASASVYPASFLFYANFPPFWLTSTTGHFWSLCVEMQFYALIALLFRAFGARGLNLLLPVCLGVTSHRILSGAEVSIVTLQRIDEILAGCVLALVFYGRLGARPLEILRRLNPYGILVLLLIACHSLGGFMNYLRPYLAAAMVGATLFRNDRWLARMLLSKSLKYVADISFALYVVHPLFGATWLGSGVGWEKYAKRPLLIAAVFGVAHLSTFQFERRCTAFGKRLSSQWQARRLAAQP